MKKRFEIIKIKKELSKEILLGCESREDTVKKRMFLDIGDFLYKNIETLPLELTKEDDIFYDNSVSFGLEMCIIDKKELKRLLEIEKLFMCLQNK